MLLILLTLLGGVLPLIERKYLSLIQRRVGPTFVGYKGRLQFIADAMKMFLKGCIKPNQVNSFFFFLLPSLLVFLCYLYWLNVFWDLNLIFFELEYNIVYILILSVFFNFFCFLTGLVSKNKYATISSARSLSLLFCTELLLGLLFLNIYLHLNSFNFSFSLILQQEYPFLILLNLFSSLILILILLDINRTPFDMTEAENELIAGFHTEYGAFFFGLFYLGEYFHLFFFSIIIITLLFGC